MGRVTIKNEVFYVIPKDVFEKYLKELLSTMRELKRVLDLKEVDNK